MSERIDKYVRDYLDRYQAYQKYWLTRQAQLQETFNKSNVDNVSIATNDDFVKSLLLLFKQRS